MGSRSKTATRSGNLADSISAFTRDGGKAGPFIDSPGALNVLEFFVSAAEAVGIAAAPSALEVPAFANLDTGFMAGSVDQAPHFAALEPKAAAAAAFAAEACCFSVSFLFALSAFLEISSSCFFLAPTACGKIRFSKLAFVTPWSQQQDVGQLPQCEDT